MQGRNIEPVLAPPFLLHPIHYFVLRLFPKSLSNWSTFSFAIAMILAIISGVSSYLFSGRSPLPDSYLSLASLCPTLWPFCPLQLQKSLLFACTDCFIPPEILCMLFPLICSLTSIFHLIWLVFKSSLSQHFLHEAFSDLPAQVTAPFSIQDSDSTSRHLLQMHFYLHTFLIIWLMSVPN